MIIGREAEAKLKAPFPEEDVLWRVLRSGSSAKGPWVQVVPYVDARAVEDRLDEVVGLWGSSTNSTECTNGMLCHLVLIEPESKTMAQKTDGASETKIEGFKGAQSKSKVRVGSSWGIGRYLYKVPRTFAKITQNKQEASSSVEIDNKWVHWLKPKMDKKFLPVERPKSDQPVAKTKTKSNKKTASPLDRKGYTKEVKDKEETIPTKTQLFDFFQMVKKSKWEAKDVKDFMKKRFGLLRTDQLSLNQLDEITGVILHRSPQDANAEMNDFGLN